MELERQLTNVDAAAARGSVRTMARSLHRVTGGTLQAGPIARLLAARCFTAFGNSTTPIALAIGLAPHGALVLSAALAAYAAGRSCGALALPLIMRYVALRPLLAAGQMIGAAALTIAAIGAAAQTRPVLLVSIGVGGIAIGASGACWPPLLKAQVPAHLALRVNGQIAAVDGASGIAGPAAAALIVATGGLPVALLCDAATFLATALLILRERNAAKLHTDLTAYGWRAGFATLRSNSWLWPIMGVFFLYQILVLPAFFVAGPLVMPQSSTWGVLVAAMAVGYTSGGLLAARGIRTPLLRSAGILALVEIPLFIALGTAAPTPVALILAIFCGASWGAGNAWIETAQQLRLDPGGVAAIAALDYATNWGLAPVGYVAAGVLAATISPSAVVIGAGVAVCVAAISLAVPNLDRPSIASCSAEAPRHVDDATPGGYPD